MRHTRTSVEIRSIQKLQLDTAYYNNNKNPHCLTGDTFSLVRYATIGDTNVVLGIQSTKVNKRSLLSVTITYELHN